MRSYGSLCFDSDRRPVVGIDRVFVISNLLVVSFHNPPEPGPTSVAGLTDRFYAGSTGGPRTCSASEGCFSADLDRPAYTDGWDLARYGIADLYGAICVSDIYGDGGSIAFRPTCAGVLRAIHSGPQHGPESTLISGDHKLFDTDGFGATPSWFRKVRSVGNTRRRLHRNPSDERGFTIDHHASFCDCAPTFGLLLARETVPSSTGTLVPSIRNCR